MQLLRDHTPLLAQMHKATGQEIKESVPVDTVLRGGGVLLVPAVATLIYQLSALPILFGIQQVVALRAELELRPC